MHTRCCEELDKVKSVTIRAGETYEYNIADGYADTPCLIECFFRCNAPLVGAVYVGNGVWNGQEFMKGRLQQVTDFATVNVSVAAGVVPGFYIEYNGGIGRALLIRNNMDVNMTDVFFSIRKLVTITTDQSKAPGKQYG